MTDNPKFCSLSHGAIHQNRVNPRPKKVAIKTCAREGCSIEFDGARDQKKKYCSHGCAAKVNNRSRRRQSGTCLNCPAELHVGKKYCSVECGAMYRRNKRIESWKAGKWSGSTQSGLATFLRSYLIELAGNRCSNLRCAVPGGFSEVNPVTGNVPLEIDHIDGDCHNNRPENLVVLCPNCHALTPTYKALNRGNGRSYRGKYDQYKRVSDQLDDAPS